MKSTSHKSTTKRIAKRPPGTSSGPGKATKQTPITPTWSATGRRSEESGEG